MGIYSTNYLPTSTSSNQVREFLQLLGFKQEQVNSYFYWNENTVEQLTVINAELVRSRGKYLKVEMSTTVSRSIHDHEIHNSTIKKLKERFGGTFKTDFGSNKYLTYDGPKRWESDAGCYFAYFQFERNLYKILVYLDYQKSSHNKFTVNGKEFITTPTEVYITIALPFLISILEEFLRGMYVSLLTYSPKKKDIFKSSKISNELLYDVTINGITIEKVIAQSKSFQNIAQITIAFKELDSRINFIDILNRTDPKENNLAKLNALIEMRHIIIHQARLDESYSFKSFRHDIELITKVASIFYNHLIKIYNWKKSDF